MFDRTTIATVQIPTEDGMSLTGRLFGVAGPARAGVVLHGAVATPARYYDGFAEHLARRGLEVLTYDYRGIGGSRPRSLHGYDATLSQWAELDAVAATRMLHRRDRDRPLFVVGHSFGGQVGLALPELPPVAGAFFVAAQNGYWRGFPAPTRWRMFAVWNVGIPAMTSLFGYVPAFAGLGVDLPKGVAQQWRRWCLHPEYYLGEHPEYATRLHAYRGPVLALSFTDDRFVPRSGADWFVDRLPRARLEHRHLHPSSVGLPAIDHFGFFRRRNADALWPIADDFFDGVLARTWTPRPDPTRITEREVIEQLQTHL